MDRVARFQADEAWPKSYNIYHGKLTFCIAAHSEEQAEKRLRDLETFLEGLFADAHSDSGVIHEAVRYVFPASPGFAAHEAPREHEIQLKETVEVASAAEIAPHIGLDDLPEWYWIYEDDDAAYDPTLAAHLVHIGGEQNLDQASYDRIRAQAAERGITLPEKDLPEEI